MPPSPENTEARRSVIMSLLSSRLVSADEPGHVFYARGSDEEVAARCREITKLKASAQTVKRIRQEHFGLLSSRRPEDVDAPFWALRNTTTGAFLTSRQTWSVAEPERNKQRAVPALYETERRARQVLSRQPAPIDDPSEWEIVPVRLEVEAV